MIEQIARDSGLHGKVRMISNYEEIPCSLDSIFIHNFDIKGELKDDQNSCYEISRYYIVCNIYILHVLCNYVILKSYHLLFQELT